MNCKHCMTGKFGRRSLLQAMSAATGGLLLADLFPRTAFAGTLDKNRKFVFAYFDGGWDILLGLDPRDPVGNNPATSQIDPGYDQLGYGASSGVQTAGGLKFGPAVPASFLQVAGECSIINGVGMDTAAHEVGRRYFLTGQFPRGLDAVGSSVGAYAVSQMGEGSQIPFIAAGTEAYNDGLPAFASALTVNTLNDMAIALNPLVPVDPKVQEAMQKFQDGGPGCAGWALNRDGLVAKLEDSIARSRGYVTAMLGSNFDLTRSDAEMQALIGLYDIGAAYGDLGSPEVLSFLAGQSLKKGISQCVSVRMANSLDTHSNWAQDQLPAQQRGWKALAALLTDLKNTPGAMPNTSMLDETTVIAFSEFGRTPLFNSIRGRDHFLGNSALIAGAGVKHGMTVGKSADVGMMPVYCDPLTGQGFDAPPQAQIDSGAVTMLSPQHVLATVLASAGIDYSYLRVDPIKALLP